MPAGAVSRRVRRTICVFTLAVIYAFVFFEVGILYQGNKNKRAQVTQQRESVSDFHHQPHILLKSLEHKLKGEMSTREKINSTSFSIGKMTSSSEAFDNVNGPMTQRSQLLFF